MIKKQDQLKQLDEASNIPKYKIYLNIIGLGNVPKPIRKSVNVLKDKFISLFNINTPKQTVYGEGQKLKKPFLSEENKENIKGRIIIDI